jgi:hypothetical protein
MHVTIRKYTGKGALVDKLVPPVRDGLVPLLKRAPGFKGYCAFASEDGHIVSVSLFADRPSAERATEQVRGWVQSNLRDLLPDPPEVVAGEAVLHGEAELQDGGPALFAAVRLYDGLGPREEMLAKVREHVFPAVAGAPGFRGYYGFFDDRRAARGGAVSLFDTREHAMAAQEKTVAAMREGRIAPDLPRVMAGWTAIVAAAEH